MDKQAFKQRMQLLKTYRDENPGKSYLDFKSYQEGGETPRPLYKTRLEIMKSGITEDGKIDNNLIRNAVHSDTKEFANYWYNERFKNPVYKELAPGDQLLKMMDRINTATYDMSGERMLKDAASQVKALYPNAPEASIQLAAYKETIGNRNIMGSALPDDNSFWVRRSNDTKATVHEGIGHMGGDKNPNLLKAVPYVPSRLTNLEDPNYSKYLERPNERNALTLEFRYENRGLKDDSGNYYIDPNRLLAPEDMLQMRTKGAIVPDAWKSNTDDDIIKLHNTIASTNIPTKDGIQYAKDGGEIKLRPSSKELLEYQDGEEVEVTGKEMLSRVWDTVKDTFSKSKDVLSSPIQTGKDLIYRIMSQEATASRSKEQINTAVKLWVKNDKISPSYSGTISIGESGYGYNENRDLLNLYLNRNEKGFKELSDSDKSKGYNYDNYSKKYGYDPKSYYGLIYNNDTIYLDKKLLNTMERLSNDDKTIGFINNHPLLTKEETYGMPLDQEVSYEAYADDVAGHLGKIGKVGNNLELQASDMFDFNPGDYEKMWKGEEAQYALAKALDIIGNPFILKQNIPLKFIEPKTSLDSTKVQVGLDIFTNTYGNVIPKYNKGGEVPPTKPNIPDEPMPYKGKLIKDKHGKSYTEDLYYDYLANSTDEISRFDNRPMVRGMKGAVDLQDAADLTPIGDMISAKDTYDAIKNKDWAGAGLAALTMIPFVPQTVKQFRKNYKGITPKARMGVSSLNYNTSVNKNYTQDLINQMNALNERDTKKLVKAINQSYNLAERLIDDPEYLLRAEQVNKLFGDDYSKAYADIIDAYNTDPGKLPGVAVKKNMKNNARGSMELFNDGTYDYNIDPQLTNLDEYLTEHEYGHYADWRLSGFVPDPGTGNKMFKEMQKDFKPEIGSNSYFGKPTELKSHMNQLREYMFLNGYINKRGQKVEEKMLKNVLDDVKNIEGLKEVHTASTAFKNMSKYTKWFNTVPLLGMGVMGINKLTNNKNE